jgi:3-oxoacyl-[acyl-carrier-protein] synthase-3
MRFDNVSILGLGVMDAPDVCTSAEIEEELRPVAERLGVNPHLLSELTGIFERRFWPAGTMPSEVAAAAGELALEDAGVPRENIGVLINTSVCQDWLEPSTAALVHGRMKMPASCLNFDLRNACLGFVNGIQVAGNMIERGQVDYALLVDGEQSRTVTEATIERLKRPDVDKKRYREQYASLTLGSGAVAMVLGRTDRAVRQAHRVTGGVSLAASEWNHLCVGNMDEMRTDASTLLMAGLSLAWTTWQQAQSRLGWSVDVLDHYVVHQISHVHTTKMAESIGADVHRFYKIYPTFGNIGPAGVPTVLKKAVDAGVVRQGQRLALMGIGSGLNCAMMEVVW